MVTRIPIMDVRPVIEGGRYPVKATVDEPFSVSASVFREGHDQLGCGVVLTGPDGSDRPLLLMRPDAEEPDLYSAEVRPDAEGAWTYRIEAWSDPYATWNHDATIKIEAGVDVDLMLTEGGLVLERAAQALPADAKVERRTLTDAVTALRDTARPVEARLAAGIGDAVVDVFTRFPLRELLSRSWA